MKITKLVIVLLLLSLILVIGGLLLLQHQINASDDRGIVQTSPDLGPTGTSTSIKATNCLYLCWDKLMGEYVTWPELEPMIMEQGWEIVDLSQYLDNPDPNQHVIRINVINFEASDKSNEDMSAYSGILVSNAPDRVIDRIEITVSHIGKFYTSHNPNKQTWDTFGPYNILHVYGPPSSIKADVVYTGNGAERSLTFIWEKIGLFASYSMAPSNDYSESVETCLDIENIQSARLLFYGVDNFETSLREREGILLPKTSNVELFKDLTSMEEVAQTVLEEDCFELTFVKF